MKDTFIALVREAGNGSHELTIPYNLFKFLGLQTGDIVKVMLEKEKEYDNK